MKDIAICGAGGFGREIACLINLINEKEPTWNLIGFFNDGIDKDSTNEYGEILGGNEELNSWDKDLAVVIAIGNPNLIQKIITIITNPNIYYPNIIAPDFVILDKGNYIMGKGNIFQTKSGISCNVNIGDFNIFNGYNTIGHDTMIGSCNVFMPSVKISGGVEIGNRNFMGISSVVLQNLKIGNDVRVGAGSVIMRKTQDNTLYMGNPAVKMKF